MLVETLRVSGLVKGLPEALEARRRAPPPHRSLALGTTGQQCRADELVNLIHRSTQTAEHTRSWSNRRRRRQHQARLSHYKRRGYPLNRVPLQC